MAELLIQKSDEFNIDLNAKDNNGMTGFDLACEYRQEAIADLLKKNAESFKIDLTPHRRTLEARKPKKKSNRKKYKIFDSQ